MLENLLLAIALLCKQNYNYPESAQRACAKRIIECFASDKKININSKVELLKFAECLGDHEKTK